MLLEHADWQLVLLSVASASVTLDGTIKLNDITLQGRYQVAALLHLSVVF